MFNRTDDGGEEEVVADVENQLTALFERHAPAEISKIPRLLRMNRGKESMLLFNMREKFKRQAKAHTQVRKASQSQMDEDIDAAIDESNDIPGTEMETVATVSFGEELVEGRADAAAGLGRAGDAVTGVAAQLGSPGAPLAPAASGPR